MNGARPPDLLCAKLFNTTLRDSARIRAQRDLRARVGACRASRARSSRANRRKPSPLDVECRRRPAVAQRALSRFPQTPPFPLLNLKRQAAGVVAGNSSQNAKTFRIDSLPAALVWADPSAYLFIRWSRAVRR